MAKHKHKNPRVKVYFRYKSRCCRLLEAINFGTKTSPELKIKGLAETYMQTKDDLHRFDGKFHVGQQIRFIEGKNVEFTYHKDGSVLSEIILPTGQKEHDNPYGEGVRWTPIADITTYQPVMVFQLLSLADYRPAFIEEKSGLKNYEVKNDGLFEFQRGQGLMVLVYLKHKDYPLARFCFDNTNYSDVLMKFGENLELCIFIQKQMTPDNAGSTRNNFTFVDRLDGYDYMTSVLKNHIFNPKAAAFMNALQQEGNYFDVSEKMVKVIETIGTFYGHLQKAGIPNLVQEAVLARMLLDKLDGRYDDYLSLSNEEQMKFVLLQFLSGLLARTTEGSKEDRDNERDCYAKLLNCRT